MGNPGLFPSRDKYARFTKSVTGSRDIYLHPDQTAVAKGHVGSTRAEERTRRARNLLLLVLILLLGLVLRVGYLRELTHTPDFAAPLADAAFHNYWARALVTGDWTRPEGRTDPHVRTTPYQRPPGYVWFLALVYRVAGPGNYLAIRLVQMALGLVSAALAYGLGCAVFGRAAGLLAALFLCTHWAFIYYEGELQEPSLLVLLGLLALLVLHKWAARPGIGRAALGGLLLGACALVRPNVLLFLPVAAVWIGWVHWRRGQRSQVAPSALALLMAVAVPIVPVTIRNYVVAHDFVPIASNGAISLYVGNNERSDGYTAPIPELYELIGKNTWSWFDYDEIVAGVAAKLGRPVKQSEVAPYFHRKALRYMQDNPLRCLGLAAKRALLFWGPAEVANNKEVHYERQFSSWLWWLPGFPLAAATGVLGLIFVFANRLPRREATGEGSFESAVLILLFILTWFASFVPFLVAERFRTPVAPLVALFGAYAVVRLGHWAEARDWRRLAGWGAVGAALLAAAEVNWGAYEPRLGGWHMARGDAYGRVGKWDQASAEYARVIELKPTNLAARKNLAATLYRQGRLNEALEQYSLLAELTPNDPSMHIRMGGLLLELNRFSNAEQAFREAARLDPGMPDAHYNLGLVLTRQGRTDEAIAAYRAALESQPAYHQARVNLGALLAQKGQLDAAIAEYRHVLDYDPRRFDALYNLASALNAQGQTDQAAAMLERALEVRPDDAAARRAFEALQRPAAGK